MLNITEGHRIREGTKIIRVMSGRLLFEVIRFTRHLAQRTGKKYQIDQLSLNGIAWIPTAKVTATSTIL